MADRRPRAVVTGGLGFIGSHLLDRLEAEGLRLLVIDTDGEPRPGPTREWLLASVTDSRAARAVERFEPRLLVHAAAQTQVARSVSHPLEDARTNVMGTLLMLEAARAAGVRGFIFISSAALRSQQAGGHQLRRVLRAGGPPVGGHPHPGQRIRSRPDHAE